ncbi:Non-reducing polyketide synthase azaA [Lasiodiplodia hormozganensis]|uniref:Non-reducing polyketide synthase azaA n=1 Tax=Lasiodiplodia hormozganensis TaxID=869390 RepID=A0AA40CMP5_9PEZI|nr:Non-reducing polyketide synthase azaA [Lasiodiplodia hormozganensis]
MTVPSILEDIVNLAPAELASGFALLKPLRFVAVGGGPLKPEVGEALVAGGVNVLNHYGATEIGAIAPIFRPGADYDWRYLRLRNDLGLELQQASSEGVPEHEMRYRLVGYPIGWNRPFYIQDEILKRPGSKHVEVKILGRQDDLIVLKTGEKVSPQGIEELLMKDSSIKTAVCVGQGRFELAVLIEPSSTAPADEEQLVEHVWQLVCLANRSVDQHAQISSKHAVIIKPSNKAIPRSDKGSVMRREVHDLFEQEINAAYEALDLESFASSATLNMENLEDGITSLIGTVLGQDVWFRSEDDLFELGVNSLQATRLARFLNSSFSNLLPRDREDVRITAAFIYQHPSVSSLAKAIRAALSSRSQGDAEYMQDRTIQMQALADELVEEIRTDQPRNRIAFDFVDNSSVHYKVVLLTGSTGNLGCHMLGRLVRMRQITRIICLNRVKPGGTVSDLRERQEQVNAAAGVVLNSETWNKIEFVAANTQAPDLGLTQEQRTQLARTVTHVVHLAWPMDFNRRLHSFKPQLQALKALVSLCRDAHHARGGKFNPRLVFASSIAVVRHYPDLTGSSVVPEDRLPDPRVAAAMGYAEAKWVCEEFLFRVGQMYADEVTPMVVRIGQLSGPEREGIWKTEEHVPALVKASQMISAFPNLKGNFSWLPVDRAAAALSDILLQDQQMPNRFYHLENPIRQPLVDVGTFVIDELKLQQKRPIPFENWLERVAATGYASSLINFFQNEFRSLADGSTALETSASRKASLYLRGERGIGKDLVVEYIRRWKKLGFLT